MVRRSITRRRRSFLSGSYLSHYGVANRRRLLESVGTPRTIPGRYAAFRVAFVTESPDFYCLLLILRQIISLLSAQSQKKRGKNSSKTSVFI